MAGVELAGTSRDGRSHHAMTALRETVIERPIGPTSAPGADYAELRRAVLAAALLDRAYGYYLLRGGLCFAFLLVAAAFSVILPRTAWSVLLVAPMLAFSIVQVALLGHDAGHLEVFRSTRRNWALGLLCWSTVAGVGFWYWNDRHNRHHGHTNDPGADPDLQGGGLLAFTEEEAAARHGWRRVALRYQGVLIVLAACTLAFVFRVESAVFAWRTLRGARRAAELALLSANLLVWLLVIVGLGWFGVGLLVSSQVAASLYLAALIAPNHKGMPVWAKDAQISFLERQVLGSRNVTSHPVWDFVFGGLNYQIEHHLFPNMPRVNFKRARAIVKPYVQARGLDYLEVGPLTSYLMIYESYRELKETLAKS
jgi:fatty acid desaturase